MIHKQMYQSTLFTLLCLVDYIQSQTGKGCYNQQVPCEPGQIRMDAVITPVTRNFVGGCHCTCDFVPLKDPYSPKFCKSPRKINFDPFTESGDCSCKCPPNLFQPSDCTYPQIHNKETCQCECPNKYSPTFCKLPREINFDPTTAAGDCSCNCPPNLAQPSDCTYPQIHNKETCQCECPHKYLQCPPHQYYNDQTCQCECINEIGTPGHECIVARHGNDPFTLNNSLILPDCTCECPHDSPTPSDCKAVGRQYNLCKCYCPIKSCNGPNQILDERTCSCQCPQCKPDEILLDEYTCECGNVEMEPMGTNVQYCCHPYYYDFTPYFGLCWGKTNEQKCNGEAGKCVWQTDNCFKGRPQCAFKDYKCTHNTDCCSKVCKSDGLCR